MRNTIAAVLVPCATLIGCADPVGGPEPVTLLGTCLTTFDPPPFPVPSAFRQTDSGTCELQGFGLVEFWSVKDIDTQAGTQATSELVLTFPNGDRLLGAGGGQNVPGAQGVVDFDAMLHLSGGTGRYSTATGEARAEGSANMMQRSASFTIEGEVRFTR